MRNRVRELREDRELSQGALAGELGVSRQTINTIADIVRPQPSLSGSPPISG